MSVAYRCHQFKNWWLLWFSTTKVGENVIESLIRNCFRIQRFLLFSPLLMFRMFWISEADCCFFLSAYGICAGSAAPSRSDRWKHPWGSIKAGGYFWRITPENLHKFSGPRGRREEVISVKKAQKKRPKPLKMKNIHWQTPNGYDMMLFHTVIVCPFRAIHPNMVMLPQMGAVVKR